MPDEVILDVTTIEENVTVETTAGDVVEVKVVATQGAAATVTVGTTTTGAAGSSASVTNSGTTSAAVFNFTIPRGDTGAAGASGGSSTAWRYRAKTNATSGYPTNGHLLWNNATQTSATAILVSHLDDEGSDIEFFLSFFLEGQKIFIQNRDDSSQNQVWEITGTPTVTGANTSTAYYTFPVTLVSSAGAAFTNNHSILFGSIAAAIAPNAVTSATTSDGTANLSVAYLGVVPSGSIALASTNSGGFVQLSGQAATDARSIAFPNASGNLALVASTTGAIASSDISDFTTAVEAIAPNAVTSATTSDGTANLSLADLEVVGGEINTDGDYSQIYTQGTDAHIFTLGYGAEIFTVGEVATIATQGANATISTAGSAAHIQTSHANAAVKSTNFAAVGSGGASLVDGSMQPCLTWSAGGRNLTIPSGTATTFNSTSYTFGAGASAALKTALAIASSDISNFTTAVQAIAPDAVTSATTSDGTALLNISNLTLSQAITSGLQTKMTFTAQPTTVGDGQQIIWQWYNGGSPLTTAVIATQATSSNSDKLLFKTSESGSLATSLDLNNSLATFSGVVSSLGATYQTGSTFTYNGASAAAHRTALGLTTLATTTPAANVATFLETPSSANLAAAVTDETGSGSLVFGTSPSLTSPTIGTSATFNATTYTYGAGAAAAHRTALGFVSKSKASSTSRSSTTTRTADPDLTFEIGANETWIFELSVLIAQHPTVQVSSQLTSPTGALISGRALTGRDGGVAGTTLFQSVNSSNLIATKNGSHHITATVVNGANAGTVAFAWAQETSNATASIVALGSYIQATKIS